MQQKESHIYAGSGVSQRPNLYIIWKGCFNMCDKNTKKSRKKITSRQIVALAGVVLLAALYLVTLVVAIFDQDNSGRLFQICLVCTIAIPLLVWVYIWMYGKLSGKHTMADLDLGREDRDDSQSPDA